MRALLVDDEPRARQNLRSMLMNYCHGVEVVGDAGSAQEAWKQVTALQPQVVFLDVQMPNVNGLEFAESIQHLPIHIAFVTAYDQFAIEALRARAFDYIIKPISIKELKSAIERWRQLKSSQLGGSASEVALTDSIHKFRVPWEGGFRILDLEDLVSLEAHNSYTEVHLKDDRLMVSMSMAEFEQQLPEQNFFRIHRSHIVNLKMVVGFSNRDGGQAIMKGGVVLPVARRKIASFRQRLDAFLI